MKRGVRRSLRWLLSVILVTFPCAYIFGQWQIGGPQVFKSLSYDSFHQRIAEGQPPTFWTYSLYVFVLILVFFIAFQIVFWVVGKFIPDAPGRKARAS